MPVEVKMPKLGLTMEAGRIVEWKKKEGDKVEEGETLLVVETEKITNEVKSPASGIVAKILANPGDEVPVGQVIAIIVESLEELEKNRRESASSKAVSEEPVGEGVESKAITPPERQPIIATASVATGLSKRPKATPAARRLAARYGIDLSKVKGTGPRGMVTEQDVKRYLEEAEATEKKAEAVAPTGLMKLPSEEVTQVGPVKGRVVEPSPMRARIASNLYKSYSQAIHTTLFMDVCVDKLVELRGMIAKEKRPSITAFVVKAVAEALVKHPYMNAGMIDGKIIMYDDINIGVAVALEDGLIVPVVKHADKKNIGVISREIEELSRKAREGNLSIEDVEGSTFSVSNLGMYDIDYFAPIIFPGHAGILGVGRLRDVASPGRDGGVIFKKCMTLSITFDHRVTDGAQAAMFLKTVKRYLEEPLELLLGL